MFDTVPVHVGFVVKELAVTLAFLLVLQVHPVITSIDRTHSHALYFYYPKCGHAVTPLVEALRYMPEGRGFDS
jgi:hypothetical protein